MYARSDATFSDIIIIVQNFLSKAKKTNCFWRKKSLLENFESFGSGEKNFAFKKYHLI